MTSTHKLIGATVQAVAILLVLVGFGANSTFAQPRGYVANRLDNTVSVIDTATNAVIATMPVGSFPSAVAVTRNGSFAYVTNSGDSTVSVIDTATNTVATTIPVG